MEENKQQISNLFEEKFLGIKEFRFVFENIPVPIIIADTEGKILSINMAGIKLLNYSDLNELKNTSLFELVYEDEGKEKHRSLFNLLKTREKKYYSAEQKFVTKDGRMKWCRISAAALIGKEEYFLGALCIGQDITDTKLKESKLQQSIKELDEIIMRINSLTGLLPICASCKRIKGEEKWEPIEQYIEERSMAEFSHGLCPDCAKKLYPEHYKNKNLPEK